MFDNWVTKYALSYSLNDRHWFMVKDKKKGNSRPKVSKCFSRSPNSEKLLFSSQAKVGQTLRIVYESRDQFSEWLCFFITIDPLKNKKHSIQIVSQL